MSHSNDEFIGRLPWFERIRALEIRMARLERHPGGEIPTVAVGEPTQGESVALGGVPGLRHFNASHVNGFRAAADARPNALLPLDPNANIDLRRAGGEIFANRVTAGYGDSTAILDGIDTTYRLWAGASAAGSATFSVTQAGALYSTTGSIGGFTITATLIHAGDFGLNSQASRLDLSANCYLYSDVGGSSIAFVNANTNAAEIAYSWNSGGSLAGEFWNNLGWLFNHKAAFADHQGGSQMVVIDAASTAMNTPTQFDDRSGGSHIASVAASGFQFNQHTYMAANKKHVLDGTTGSVYFTYDSAASRVRLYIKGVQSASWN